LDSGSNLQVRVEGIIETCKIATIIILKYIRVPVGRVLTNKQTNRSGKKHLVQGATKGLPNPQKTI
jgi:hypothetical protein